MNNEKIYIGVDGGGTKTHSVSCNQNGDILQFNKTGAANHQSQSFEKRSLKDALRPYSNKIIEVAVFTMSGWDFEFDQKIIQKNIDSSLKELNISVKNILVENDSFAVLKSGLQNNKDGIVFIVGTGCMGAAISENKLHRHFGFGYKTGEWGGGYEISKYALYRIFASEQERESPCPILKKKAIHFFNVQNIKELAIKVTNNTIDSAKIGYFLNDVFDAKNEGCKTAYQIITKAGIEHAKSILSLIKQVNGRYSIILGGGVFQKHGILPSCIDFLENHNTNTSDIRVVKSAPVYGALKWALELDGINNSNIEKNIEIEYYTQTI